MLSENIPPISIEVSKFTMKLFEQMVEQMLPLYNPMEKGPDFQVCINEKQAKIVRRIYND